MNLLSAVFHEGEGLDEHAVFTLSSAAKQELLSLILLAPFLGTNLRAEPASKMLCSDASLFGAGVASAEASPTCTLSLTRAAEHGGWYTKLFSQQATLNLEGELPEDQDGAFTSLGIDKPVAEGFYLIFWRSTSAVEISLLLLPSSVLFATQAS